MKFFAQQVDPPNGRPSPRLRVRVRVASRLALIAALAAALAACNDDGNVDGHSSAKNAAFPHTAHWLEVSNPLSPAQWLASRGADRAKPTGDPEVQRLAVLLSAANARFRESERMVANRAAQLSDMLASVGLQESPGQLLHDLVAIGGDVSQTEGFGAIGQHYFNLRAAGASRADSLAKLKARYGSNS